MMCYLLHPSNFSNNVLSCLQSTKVLHSQSTNQLVDASSCIDKTHQPQLGTQAAPILRAPLNAPSKRPNSDFAMDERCMLTKRPASGSSQEDPSIDAGTHSKEPLSDTTADDHSASIRDGLPNGTYPPITVEVPDLSSPSATTQQQRIARFSVQNRQKNAIRLKLK